jgi:hypothetical protein
MRMLITRSNVPAVVFTILAVLMGPVNGFSQTVAVPEVRDVLLENGTTLDGLVTDLAGNPVPFTDVRILSNGAQVASVQSDAAGRFRVEGMREGEHVVEGGGNSVRYRLWRPETAPPNALEEARLYVERPVAYEPTQPVYRPASAPRRGFLGRAFANYPILTTAALLGAGIGSGIAIGSSSNSTPVTP